MPGSCHGRRDLAGTTAARPDAPDPSAVASSESPVSILRLSVALLFVQAGFHAYTATLPLALARAGTPDATVGPIMGLAAVVQIPVAIGGGRLLDRVWRRPPVHPRWHRLPPRDRVILLLGVDSSASLAPFIVVRILQGQGSRSPRRRPWSLVPRLVPGCVAARCPDVAAAQNLTLVLAPLLSLWRSWTPRHLMASPLRWSGSSSPASSWGSDRPCARPSRRRPSWRAASRRYGITFRREWAVPLLIIVTYVAHWGAVTAYLPIRAEQAGADIGLYFAADGIAIFAMRFPNRLAGRPGLLEGAHRHRRRHDRGGRRDAVAAPRRRSSSCRGCSVAPAEGS